MKQRKPVASREAVRAEIASLSELGFKGLRERWKALYGVEPPSKIGRSLLIRGVAYRIQERAFGGLKPATRRLLARVGEDAAARRSRIKAPRRQVGTGTVLIREWQGTTHRVTVLDAGALFDGKCYRSLSQVAREITGSRWSGPLFFGLRSPIVENHHGTP
jgi:hypothetical protein